MKFIDEVEIEVQAGKGGAGCAHFRREKYVPLGGPDGGNGGSGGSVILRADSNKSTLLDFHYKPRWKAENGAPGLKNRKDGREGKSEIIPVPLGTQVLDPFTGELIKDLCVPGQETTLVQGGRGGKGNAFFKSATNRSPTYAQPGEEGKHARFMLSLKLLADVGLVGLPNAGKSTFISKVSNAKPKIADYPFTTKRPHLGVVRYADSKPFVIADIPGLISGASQGKGMGIQFLKHVERSRVLLHLIDPIRIDDSGEQANPLESYSLIEHELQAFDQQLANKTQIIAISKSDVLSDPQQAAEIKAAFKAKNLDCYFVSSVTGAGVQELLRKISSITS